MILVTGGTGLVGSHLLLELTRSRQKIRAIYRPGSDLRRVEHVFTYYVNKEQARELFNNIEWVEASLNDVPALTAVFSNITYVYHCAALVSFNSSHAKILRKTNIEGTANIVNLSISFKVKKLVYVSSIATMDLGVGEKEVTENYTWYPEKDHTQYAISKHGAEIEVWRASQEGVPVMILNPGVIIGSGFWSKGSSQIFEKIDHGFNYYFPKTTGFVGVKDVVKAAIKAMEAKIINEQYIVVAENRKFSDVLTEVANSLDRQAPQKKLKPWMVFTGWVLQTVAAAFGGEKMLNKRDHKALFEHTYYSNKKIKKELDFHFTPLQEVIEETAAHYRQDKSL